MDPSQNQQNSLAKKKNLRKRQESSSQIKRSDIDKQSSVQQELLSNQGSTIDPKDIKVQALIKPQSAIKSDQILSNSDKAMNGTLYNPTKIDLDVVTLEQLRDFFYKLLPPDAPGDRGEKMRPSFMEQHFKNIGLDQQNPSMFAMIQWMVEQSNIPPINDGITFNQFISQAVYYFTHLSQESLNQGDKQIFELFDVKQKGYLNYEEFVEVCESLGVFLSSSDFQKFWYKALKSNLKENEQFLNSQADFGKDPAGTVKSVVDSKVKTYENGKMVKTTTKTYTLDDGSNYIKTSVQQNEPTLNEVELWFKGEGHTGRLDCKRFSQIMQ